MDFTILSSSVKFIGSEPGRFLWHRLGQTEPEDVVVFDRRRGLTHRIISLAQEVDECMAAEGAAMTVTELAQRLSGQAQPGPQAIEDVAHLLQVMLEVELVRLQSMTQTVED